MKDRFKGSKISKNVTEVPIPRTGRRREAVQRAAALCVPAGLRLSWVSVSEAQHSLTIQESTRKEKEAPRQQNMSQGGLFETCRVQEVVKLPELREEGYHPGWHMQAVPGLLGLTGGSAPERTVPIIFFSL